MKSCKNCKNYDLNNKYCFFYHLKIIDDVSAEVCKNYKERFKEKKNIKCLNCLNINKYGYCYIKKKCISEEEKLKKRNCKSFKIKPYRKRKKK